MNNILLNMSTNPTATAYRAGEHDISELLATVIDRNGLPRLVPAEFYDQFSIHQLRLFGAKTGLYVFPTYELKAFLREEIGERKALEIGAGNGVMALELGAIATDDYQQAPDYRPDPKHAILWQQFMEAIARTGNSPVKYGPNVIRQEAMSAVVKHKPDVTYGLFVTHRRGLLGEGDGNVMGIEEHKIMKRSRYIMVGNEQTHAGKPILQLPHRTIELPGLVTRAADQSLNRVWIWEKQGR